MVSTSRTSPTISKSTPHLSQRSEVVGRTSNPPTSSPRQRLAIQRTYPTQRVDFERGREPPEVSSVAQAQGSRTAQAHVARPTCPPTTPKQNGQSRPVSRVLSRRVVAFPAAADIPLGPALPPASSELPGSAAGHRIAPLCALAPGGACPAARVATGAVRSCRTVSPLPALAGGLFSVALSRESPRLAVSQHPALWSPDFPPAVTGRRPPGRL